MVRRFHDSGVYHPDLNCFNVLVADRQMYLIDFDKARYRMSGMSGWRQQTLERLLRSLKKLPPEVWTGVSLDDAWSALLDGYHSPSAV